MIFILFFNDKDGEYTIYIVHYYNIDLIDSGVKTNQVFT